MLITASYAQSDKNMIGDMTFYHFTSKFHVQNCLKFGITKGMLPRKTDKGYILHKNIQWLTLDGNPNNQSWATQIIITYNRTEYRLKIKIPKKYRKNIISWKEYSKNKSEYIDLNQFKGSKNWFLYIGPIPRDWIKKTLRSPGLE